MRLRSRWSSGVVEISMRGGGFILFGHYNDNHNTQNNDNILKWPNNNTTQSKERHQLQCPIDSNNGSKVTCQIYRKPNHLAIDYWYRFDYSY